MMPKTNFNFTQAMAELEKINQWFQEEDLDLERALEKLRQGKELIQQCQTRLKEVETEFIEIKASFPTSNEDETTPKTQETKTVRYSASVTEEDLPF